jgi:hypothetical protein
MPRRSIRRRKARGEAAIRPVPEPALAAPECPAPERPAEPAPPDQLWQDAGSLLAICRRHAAFALASPADARGARLDACRAVWVHYAAAFSASAAAQARFADELQDVTRSLMARPAEFGAAPPPPAAEPGAADPPQRPAPLITIEELRPLLQQIIRQ